jgi:hypothetical protein
MPNLARLSTCSTTSQHPIDWNSPTRNFEVSSSSRTAADATPPPQKRAWPPTRPIGKGPSWREMMQTSEKFLAMALLSQPEGSGPALRIQQIREAYRYISKLRDNGQIEQARQEIRKLVGASEVPSNSPGALEGESLPWPDAVTVYQICHKDILDHYPPDSDQVRDVIVQRNFIQAISEHLSNVQAGEAQEVLTQMKERHERKLLQAVTPKQGASAMVAAGRHLRPRGR